MIMSRVSKILSVKGAELRLLGALVLLMLSIATPARAELTIFAAVDGAAFASDAVDGDVASYTAASSSVDAGDENVVNLQRLDINTDAVWAILFSVKMP